MAQQETDFSASPIQTTQTSPSLPQSTSSNDSGPAASASQSRQDTDSPLTNGTNGNPSAPQPNPRSCVTCRKRKVRCDKRHPCSHCNRAGIECVFPGPGRAPRRSRKPPDAELLARLRRLEGVVQHLGKNLDEEDEKGEDDVKDEPTPANDPDASLPKSPKEEKKTPKACGLFNGPEPRKSVDGVSKEFGRLQVDEGRSRYVSNKFWNSLGDEVSLLSLVCLIVCALRGQGGGFSVQLDRHHNRNVCIGLCALLAEGCGKDMVIFGSQPCSDSLT